MERVAFYTLGCKVNQYDTESMIGQFKDADYKIVDFDQQADIYIINHDLLILEDDYDKLSNLDFDLVIADEVHYFKNRTTQRTQKIKELSEDINYKLGLTGTPLQNNPEDTHSIFEFLIPGYLRNKTEFNSH